MSGRGLVEDSRVLRSKDAVITASVRLFVEGGPRAVTVEAVCESSGVAKTTIYRHWRDRAHLLADTYRACMPVVEYPPIEMNAEESLKFVVRQLVAGLGAPPARPALPHLISTPLDAIESRALPSDVMDQTFAPVVAAIQKVATANVIPADTNIAEAKHEIVGFVIMSALDAECTMDSNLADRIVRLFITGRRNYNLLR